MKLPSEHGQLINLEKIKREAFILLNVSYGFIQLKDDREGDVAGRRDSEIFQRYGEFYSQTVSELLIGISIYGRILDDIISKNEICKSASKWEYEYSLGDDMEGRHLSLRACFNKIIHAEKIDYELLQLPEIYLSGKHQNQNEWTARIFILPFCVSVFEWAEHCNAFQAPPPLHLDLMA